MAGEYRTERDTLGEMRVPAAALYGAQTARAVANFPISGWTMPRAFLRALAQIKAAFARANGEAGALSEDVSAAIVAAAGEVVAGRHAGEFPVDVFQTGSGTSTNMNMNEVIAHLANQSLGGDPASHRPVHPNDHVNLGQSSNDTIPAAIRIAAVVQSSELVRPAVVAVADEFRRLAEAHASTVTLGRTHLMDAVPTTYGRVFKAWEVRLRAAVEGLDVAAARLRAVPLGGTAVGSGIGSDPAVVTRAIELLSVETAHPLFAQPEPAAGVQAQDAPIAYADSLAAVARVLLSVANDLRLRASGPFGGLAELRLPAVQPGSSIMPGKVNPVIPEAVVQVALEIEGLAAACRASASLHQLDLSHANPLLAWNLDTMGRLLAAACGALVARCLTGIEVDAERALALAAASPAVATALAARIGYERAAEVAKAAEAGRESVASAARRLGVLSETELAEVLDLGRMAGVRDA